MEENEIDKVSWHALSGHEPSPEDSSARKLAGELREVICGFALAESPLVFPGPEVRAMIMSRLPSASGPSGDWLESAEEACVLTDSTGHVAWVNRAFTEMCGYSLEELRGEKPGRLLQGEKTDPAVARQMSDAVRLETFCTQEILNYHKNGQAYWVSVSISPIFGSDRKARGFVALERKLDRVAA